DDEDDERVVDEHATAGKVLRTDLRYARLQKLSCQDHDGDGDVQMAGDDEDNPHAPFEGDLDWRVAKWAVEDEVRQNSLDRLLSIPGV
ncbi:hypothetical protein BDN72DRAFT_745379, partial [Pluteus cervinus]